MKFPMSAKTASTVLGISLRTVQYHLQQLDFPKMGNNTSNYLIMSQEALEILNRHIAESHPGPKKSQKK